MRSFERAELNQSSYVVFKCLILHTVDDFF
jgi:hypothetical protein